jgi:hypothetical protein
VPKEGSTFTFTFKIEQKVSREIRVSDEFKLNSCDLEFKWVAPSGEPQNYVGGFDANGGMIEEHKASVHGYSDTEDEFS